MARHPDWFQQLDAILAAAREAPTESFGRREIRALFGCAERDSIRLLHKFGAVRAGDALSLPRISLVSQLEAISRGPAYTAFHRKRRHLARHLAIARADHVARGQLIAGSVDFQPRSSFADLPPGVRLERGRITCDFARPEDFWKMIDQLADIAASHPDSFEKEVAR